MKNFASLFGQIQKLQTKFKEFQDELANKVIEASAGGDMVTVKMNGKKEVISIKISKEVVNPDDVEMLEDLIIAAINQAQNKVQEIIQDEISKITGGLNIPGLSDLSNIL